MKLARDKKAALTGLGVFLGFMAVCTVISRGIYTSGLPRVGCAKPYSTGIAHTIKVNATVSQGEEYGIYVEEGLRVAVVSVGKGDAFESGQALFQIETEDLEDIVEECRLALSKLEAQQADAVKEGQSDSQERRMRVDRAREDYNAAVAAADALIQSRQLALDMAQTALALYDAYLQQASAEIEHDYEQAYARQEKRTQMVREVEECTIALENTKREKEADVLTAEMALDAARAALELYDEYISQASAQEQYDYEKAYTRQEKREQLAQKAEECAIALKNAKQERETDVRRAEAALEAARTALARYDEYLAQTAAQEGYDYERAYAGQEKRVQLVQEVATCTIALEDAIREKETSLQTAARTLEDAEASAQSGNQNLEVNMLALDAERQRKRLEKLEELMDAQGWVYASDAGRMVDCRLKVGERTRDEAGMVYARDDGEKILETVFSQDEAKYLFEGVEFAVNGSSNNGGSKSGKALLEYMEKREGGELYGKLSLEEMSLAIGQTVELSYQTQTSVYNICIPMQCIHQEGEDRYYVYVAEEKEGILGTEWKVRKVGVTILDKNDNVAAIQSSELSTESRVVLNSDKDFNDGDVVRVM